MDWFRFGVWFVGGVVLGVFARMLGLSLVGSGAICLFYWGMLVLAEVITSRK